LLLTLTATKEESQNRYH